MTFAADRRSRFRPALRWLCSGLLALGFITAVMQPAAAVSPTIVSLTFDNGSVSQYALGYVQALQPHGQQATFFVNSGTVGASGSFMTWAQLGTLAGAGNDIGGKTVNATNLTTDPNPKAQVCNDRAALLQHGLQPAAFAYPGGANNPAVQAIVQSCGYGNARTAGGVSPGGAVEALPPGNWLATKAYAPSAVTLANMESVVNGADSHGGGWAQIVIGRVCSATLDASNYTSCTASSGHIELSDLNAFLDWMASAGQTGGAPAGASLATVRAAVSSADGAAPTTKISCNGDACQDTPYTGVVTVSLAATDVGSSVAATTYTTDGTDPTPNSTTYTGPFTVNGSSDTITVKFRSWDYAGNAEAVQTQVIQAPPDTAAPTTSISCNDTACDTSPYIASVTVSLSAADDGGSGLAATYYTTDGSTPTTDSTAYASPFTLTTPGTYQVEFFSTDKAGNAEPVQTQQIKVVPVTTRVSLTFDNGTISQYSLGYQQALQPHGADATFFVKSGTIGNSNNTMNWTQLGTLAAAGNDIGGKTVSSTDLTTDGNPTAQVCDDRAALINHGLDPVAFAYPGGTFNASVKAIVNSCGYGTGRSAGSLAPNGPTYAETLPPKDWYATRAYAPTGQMTLANMKAMVTGAASHGGGWAQFVIGRVCSQTLDPDNYAACTASGGWIELDDLNGFLDWMDNAGQSGGAPAGAALSTVRDAAISADTSAPTTTIACNGDTCASSTYTSTVYVTLSSSDVGSAVASTHYTLDGTNPTLSSPTYTKPIPITATTQVQFRSWDHAGNAEATNSQLITADLPPDTTPPTTVIECDGNPCGGDGYNGKTSVTLNASDPGGWGVDQTYYTLDGSTPTTSSTVYSGPLTLDTAGTYTVQFFSTDLAGNSEQVQSEQITVLPPKVIVSLTFDDGLLTQYQLADKKALKPHNLTGTFYNVSGLNNVDEQHMTWADLTDLNNDGNEIGGHTVDHVSLKGMTDLTHETYEVCQDKKNMEDHGLYPTSFAYPTGAYDVQAEQVAQSCGYTSARAAGGLNVGGEGAGPVYTETIPPANPYALRTEYDAPDVVGGVSNVPPLSLSHLETAVTAAAQHGGGWVPLVFHDICSQQYDPDNYSFCINDWGPIELDTLNQFLDWLNAAGQPGGAPPRTAVETVSQVINGPDVQNPISVLDCDKQACASGTYSGSTTVSFASKDPGGSGVAATYYTTDGSTPTTSSPKFTSPFTINQTTTLNYFSVDNAGNVEPVQTTTITVQANPDPIIGAAGDIACDPDFPAFNNGLGTDTDCRASHTVDLLNGVDAVLPLGDVQYQCSGPAAYAQAYDPTWGVKKSITHPVPGGEDYLTSGGTDCQSTPGAGYYGYFGASAGDPTKGYYSYNLGQWHIVAINTAPCEDGDVSWCAAGSAMDQWLQQDLAANQSSCTLAYYQDPRWASSASGSGGDDTYQQIWADLANGGVDVALNGDSHWYERFAQLNANGQIDTAHGVREFIVGTGGAGLDTPGAEVATSQVLNATTHGVLRMTLHNGSYDWAFVPDEGTFTDAGSANCHAKVDSTPPVTTAACNSASCSNGWYASTVDVSLTATDAGSGVSKTYYTTDGSTPTTSSTVYTGPFPLGSTSTVKYFSVDVAGNAEPVNSQVIQVDSSPPGTTAACNGSSCAGTYTSAVQFSLSASDNVGGSGVNKIYYTTDGSTPTTSSAVYSSPLTISSTTTVKFFAVDVAGNAEPVNTQQVIIGAAAPSTTITCNSAACSSGWYTGAVQATLSATDGTPDGTINTYYTTDGSTPSTSSTLYTEPFSVAATTTVKFLSVDGAGNTEPVHTQQIRIDTGAPTTSMTCSNGSCAGWFAANVTVRLSAADGSGGSGVSGIHYTTDGSTPTLASPLYTAAFTLTSTTTVKFFAADVAGNAEPANTQLVQIDKTAPTTTIQCNNATCSGTYSNSVSVTLTANDNAGGSGVASTHYTIDGTTPTLSSPAYNGAFTLTASATVQYRSWDAVGKVEAVRSKAITVGVDSPPNAVLKVTPTSGPTPLPVTADASGSTDTDLYPIRNYTYDWGDGTAPATTTAKTAKHTFMTGGTYTVTLTVTDKLGLKSTATTQVAVQQNLVTNSGFETDTAGWGTTSSSVTVSRTTLQHHTGTASAQIVNTASTAQAATLVDSPASESQTSAGTYTATLWVKAPRAATLTLQLAEMNGSTLVGSASKTIQLTTAWQSIKVTYAPTQPGATSLQFSASIGSVRAATTAFYADDAAIVRN